jgi:hypothetical protein
MRELRSQPTRPSDRDGSDVDVKDTLLAVLDLRESRHLVESEELGGLGHERVDAHRSDGQDGVSLGEVGFELLVERGRRRAERIVRWGHVRFENW